MNSPELNELRKQTHIAAEKQATLAATVWFFVSFVFIGPGLALYFQPSWVESLSVGWNITIYLLACSGIAGFFYKLEYYRLTRDTDD